jgi:hypothetical protein
VRLLTEARWITPALVGLSASSQAGTISSVPTITITTDAGQQWQKTSQDLQQYVTPVPGGGYTLDSELHFPGIWNGLADVVIKDLVFDPDPFVLNNVLITNNTSVTQNYTVNVELATSFPAPNIIFGEVHTAAIDGGGAAGATVATIPGSPIYAAKIDGVTVETLQGHPFDVVAPPAGTASATASFGPNVSLVPVTTSIGIELRFSLTARDTAAILSRFDVVPEPSSSLLLLAAAAIGSVVCRRRRG